MRFWAPGKVVFYHRSPIWSVITFHHRANCKGEETPSVLKFIGFDENPARWHILVQDLSQWIWYLHNLVEICHVLNWHVFLGSELTNKHGFGRVIIKRFGLRDSDVNFRGLYIVQVWNLNSNVDFYGIHIQNSLKIILWDRFLRSGRVYAAWTRCHTLFKISTYSCYINNSFPDQCIRFAIHKKQFSIVSDIRTVADPILKRSERVFTIGKAVSVIDVFVRAIHRQLMACDSVETVVTRQLAILNPVDAIAGRTKTLCVQDLGFWTLKKCKRRLELVFF